MAFKTLRPVQVTDAVLVSSTVPENDHPPWQAGQDYAQFARVIRGHRIYESGMAGVSNTPPEQDPQRWVDVDPTNRWRMFDAAQLVRTRAPHSAQYVFKPGQAINGLIVLDTVAVESVRVRMQDPVAGLVYDKTVTSQPTAAPTWFNWLYGPYESAEVWKLREDLPGYPNATLTVDFTGGAGMELGPILFGDVREWGLGVKVGARLSITDYSLNEVNEFGRRKYVKRGWASGGAFDLVLDNSALDDLYRHIVQLREAPAVLVPSERWTSTIFYGRMRCEVLIAYPDYSDVSITIEGLVNND
ncbi:MAG: carbohydrate-binding protein [Comamonadaceae bacterium]|nr:carbohydrate-binding protein [Comamonadaceae bacterium]